MSIQFFRWFAFAACMIAGSSTAADRVAPSQPEALALLQSNEFAELDRRYSGLQAAYKARSISDEDLRAAFRVFYATNPALAPKYELWVRQFPKSYVAHLARGIYYKKVGLDRRGDKFMSETSADQIAGMETAFAIADQELRERHSHWTTSRS